MSQFLLKFQDLEYQPVDHTEHFVGVGVQDHAEDNEPVKEGKHLKKSTCQYFDLSDFVAYSA